MPTMAGKLHSCFKELEDHVWSVIGPSFARPFFLGRIRGALKREPLLNPLLALLNRDLIHRVYIFKGPPNPIPYFQCRSTVSLHPGARNQLGGSIFVLPV